MIIDYKKMKDPWILFLWYRKYHSGIICKGVNNILNSIELSECENINILKLFWYNILIK